MPTAKKKTRHCILTNKNPSRPGRVFAWKKRRTLRILADDRSNLIADLMSYLSAQKVTVCALNARLNSDHTVTIDLTLQVANKQELEWVIKQLGKRQDTIEIFRV